MKPKLNQFVNCPMMNNRKIKLALTVGLMNSNSDPNVVGSIKHTMLGFKEVGSYLGLSLEFDSKTASMELEGA